MFWNSVAVGAAGSVPVAIEVVPKIVLACPTPKVTSRAAPPPVSAAQVALMVTPAASRTP